MKKKILALIMGVLMGIGALAPVGSVYAEGEGDSSSCNNTFLGLRPWYYGLTDASCEVKLDTGCTPDAVCDADKASAEVAKFIWVIILNVLSDAMWLAGLIAVGFIIYGGYLNLRSGGDVAYATKGRKTLTAAIVGLVIVVLASVISQLIVTVLTSS